MKRIRLPLNELLDPDISILFYDIETDHQHAPYTRIKTIAVQYGLLGKPHMVNNEEDFARFAKALSDPATIKVDFNGNNFDSIALVSAEYEFDRTNHVDLFLAMKVLAPSLPAYSLKFLNFYYFKDPHFPQLRLNQWCRANKKALHEAPLKIIEEYNCHDVTQTCNLFRMAWNHLIQPENWKPFCREMAVGNVLEEMELRGGAVIDVKKAYLTLQDLQIEFDKRVRNIENLTDGLVTNPFSAPQLGKYFDEEENIEMKLTASGEFSVNKKLLASILDQSPVAREVRAIRKAKSDMNFLGHFLSATDDLSLYGKPYFVGRPNNWIPVQVSQSSAATRRFTSSSYHKINWQNLDKNAKGVINPPKGYIWWGIDLSQIENIIHIYYSKDEVRRAAYEADPEWNEYVWLSNQILGTNHKKEDLDGDTKTGKKGIPSKEIPGWTVYKQYKTGKLGMNFGMGQGLFCETFGLPPDAGRATFEAIHRACPAIHHLQSIARDLLIKQGYVKDPFGFRYSGPPRMAYKVVAYWVQGCGTGSLPKQMMVADWKTLRNYDRFARNANSGYITGTTHDEISGIINLQLGKERILELLSELMFNMTEMFSPYFDDIPIRAKLSLSRTNVADAVELDLIKDRNQIKEMLKI